MVVIAFFNNKGGVGKTTLVYHLSHMFAQLGYKTLAVDLDPQANLTSAFFTEENLEQIWDEDENKRDTIIKCIFPILDGIGDVIDPLCHNVADNLFLVAGDLALSRFEDKLSDSWPRGHENDVAALRATSAFYRTIQNGVKSTDSEIVLIDVGPNLGAINRAALLSADFIVIPLAADLFSLQGLRNLGPTVRNWRLTWNSVKEKASVVFSLPTGMMKPAGYVVLQHAVRLDRPTRAFAKWLKRMPEVYRTNVLNINEPNIPESAEKDQYCLATLRNYRSLMPMAQESRKPIFNLKPADGIIGNHAILVRSCYDEFKALALEIARKCGIVAPE